jgi:hypothetical protein
MVFGFLGPTSIPKPPENRLEVSEDTESVRYFKHSLARQTVKAIFNLGSSLDANRHKVIGYNGPFKVLCRLDSR